MSATADLPWRNWGRAWGILVLAGLFASGGYFLIQRSFVDYHDLVHSYSYAAALVGSLFTILAVIGLVKGEIIFRRKVLARALTRARGAIGETAWIGDLPLAPFCMLSMYRPWKPAHAISSWVLIPLMVGLAFFFRFGLPGMVGPEVAALIRGPVYFGVGVALLYAAAIYLAALGRLVSWWSSDGQEETVPLPSPTMARN